MWRYTHIHNQMSFMSVVLKWVMQKRANLWSDHTSLSFVILKYINVIEYLKTNRAVRIKTKTLLWIYDLVVVRKGKLKLERLFFINDKTGPREWALCSPSCYPKEFWKIYCVVSQQNLQSGKNKETLQRIWVCALDGGMKFKCAVLAAELTVWQ